MSLNLDKVKMQILKADDRSLEAMFDHVANGGSLTELCVMWGLKYSEVMKTIRANPVLKSQLDEALKDREEWDKERVRSEVRNLGTYSIKDIFNSDGSRKSPHELPDGLLAAIKEVTADGDIKFIDKIKPLDMLGKQVGLFVERREITGTLTLEQILSAATKDEPKE